MVTVFRSTLFLICALSIARAQTFGEFTGTVTDASGAAVAAAAVKVSHAATNQVRQVTTNESGNFTVPFLVPGIYDITVEKDGFKSDTRKQVELQVGAVARLNFTLEIGAVTQVLEVTGGAPLLETENAAVGTVVENKRIVEMPLNGRNYLQLVALSANVTHEMGWRVESLKQ